MNGATVPRRPGPTRARSIPLGVVDLWQASLSSSSVPAGLEHTLSREETMRADRLRQPRHRERFVAAHATLRAVLSQYLGTPSELLCFGRGPCGKPVLSFPPRSPLQFNLSHSEDRALIAVACERSVGVDLEWVDPVADYKGLARTFFSARECTLLGAVPARVRNRAILRMWTMKEAYLKATGDGVPGGLEDTELPMVPGFQDPAGWTPMGPAVAGGTGSCWSARLLPVDPPFVAAVASSGSGWAVREREIEELDPWAACTGAAAS